MLRIVGWGSAAAFVLLPLLAMQFTDEIAWDLADFVLAGALVTSVGVTYELAARTVPNRAYRAAVAVALATAFTLVWVNAAVGMIGSEDNPANLMYGGVLAVGMLGALLSRLRPSSMAHALVATAFAQAAVAVTVAVARWDAPASGPLEILVLNGAFASLWLTSAWLFGKAARQ